MIKIQSKIEDKYYFCTVLTGK